MQKEEPKESLDFLMDSLLKSYKRILLEGIEVCIKDTKEHNRVENFTNGFLEGALLTSQFILEEAMHSQENIGLILEAAQAIHRSAHMIQGDFIEEKGSCGFIKRFQRKSTFNFVTSLIKEILSEPAPSVNGPKKAQLTPKKSTNPLDNSTRSTL